MTNFVAYVALGLILLVPILLYKKLYFRPITMICIESSETVRCVSLKPGRKSLSTLLGSDVASCPIKPGYVAFYNPSDLSDCISFDKSIDFGTCLLISSVRRGRYVSSSLSDRSISDILSKITFHTEV